jgi:acyl carrier protein
MSGTAIQAIGVDQVVEAITNTLRERRGSAPDIGPDTRLESLDLNSLDYAEVFVSIQEVVGFELDPESAGEVEVVRDLGRLQPL